VGADKNGFWFFVCAKTKLRNAADFFAIAKIVVATRQTSFLDVCVLVRQPAGF
jgi:hypothetical protein